MLMQENRKILGIDPGTKVLGYGIIEIAAKNPVLILLGVVELSKYENHFDKLKHIYERVGMLIDTYRPGEMSVEAPFYGKNVQSMLKLGRAQGAAIAAAISRNIPVYEYAPRRIKQSITGNGNASKEQVAGMLKRIINVPDTPENLDATDGLAAAVCHYFKNEYSETRSGAKSWKEFIAKNPGRVDKR